MDDTTLDNGPVYLLPRDLDQQTDVADHKWDSTARKWLVMMGKSLARQPSSPLDPSFSSLTLHRSSPNTSDAARRANIAMPILMKLVSPKLSPLLYNWPRLPKPRGETLAEKQKIVSDQIPRSNQESRPCLHPGITPRPNRFNGKVIMSCSVVNAVTSIRSLWSLAASTGLL